MTAAAVVDGMDMRAYLRSRGVALRPADRQVIRCPIPDHDDSSPSCSIDLEARVWDCHGCGRSGGVIDLVAAIEGCTMREAVDIAAGFSLGESDQARPRKPRKRPEYPRQEDVTEVLRSAQPPTRDPEIGRLLASWGIPVSPIVDRLCGVLPPPGGTTPGWAWSWYDRGHRLLFSLRDERGAVRSVLARQIGTGSPKTLVPAGCKRGELLLISPAARDIFKGESRSRIVISEGEKDWLLWSARGEACIGIFAGGWTSGFAARIPDGTQVIIRTDPDEAGDRYAAQITASLGGRCELFRPRRSNEDGTRDTRDDCDLARDGDLGADPMQDCEPIDRKTPKPRIDAGGILTDSARQLAAALRAAGIVYRGSAGLVRVDLDDSPRLRRVTESWLTPIADDLIDWYRIKGKEGAEVRAMPPRDVIRGVLAGVETSELQPIVGAVSCPVLRRDGSILVEPGYDARTRLYFASEREWDVDPQRIGRKAAAAALSVLTDVFADFPFVEASDRSAALALCVTLAARDAIDGCVPMFVVSAPSAGTGKTLLAQLASIIATGHMPSIIAPARDDDEWRKRLFAAAIAGRRSILIDNVTGALGAPALDGAITSRHIEDRVLGKSEIESAPWRAVIAATGNNLAVRGDLARRIIQIRLDAGIERPESRGGFRHDDIIGHVTAIWRDLYLAAIAIPTAYLAEGGEIDLPRFGSFEAWSRLIRRALVWLGEADPYQGRPEMADPIREAQSTLLAAWSATIGSRPVTARDVCEMVGSPDLRAAVEAICPAGRVSPRALGYALRKMRDLPLDGVVLRSGAKGKSGVTWRAVTMGDDG